MKRSSAVWLVALGLLCLAGSSPGPAMALDFSPGGAISVGCA